MNVINVLMLTFLVVVVLLLVGLPLLAILLMSYLPSETAKQVEDWFKRKKKSD